MGLINEFFEDDHDVGGLVKIALTSDVTGTALFGGNNNEYRYRLGRTWGTNGRRVMFVMMKPSTADPMVNDPTVAKCVRFARKWGYDGLDVANTFAYRATDQGRLIEITDPVGPDNDCHIKEMAKDAGLVIFVYGTSKIVQLQYRGPEVVEMLKAQGVQPHYLKLSKKSIPWHPLYLPETTIPKQWNF